MKDAAFRELLTSVRQAGRIRRGRLKPGRVTAFKPADVKAVRAGLGQSQEEFALMIGVSVATLRSRSSVNPSLAVNTTVPGPPIVIPPGPFQVLSSVMVRVASGANVTVPEPGEVVRLMVGILLAALHVQFVPPERTVLNPPWPFAFQPWPPPTLGTGAVGLSSA